MKLLNDKNQFNILLAIPDDNIYHKHFKSYMYDGNLMYSLFLIKPEIRSVFRQTIETIRTFKRTVKENDENSKF